MMNLRKWLDTVEVFEVLLVLFWFVTGWSPNLLHHKPQPNLISSVTVTAYQNEKKQTDSSPYVTSVGWPSVFGQCAVAQNWITNGTVKYGDVLEVPGLGVFMVADVMNIRYTNNIDILVHNRIQVKLVGKRHGQTVRVLHDR